MIKLLLIFGSFFSANTPCAESIYVHSVTTIEGTTKQLANYQGKKMLIMTLPVQQNSSNDSLLHSLDSLYAAYNGSLVIIASPSYEDGYTPAQKENLKQWYRSILRMDIIVTEGLYTRKQSGSQQHSLYKWLTTKTENNHFDKDVTGPRNKFIVWTNGELIGILGAPTKLGAGVIADLLQQ